MAFDAKDVRASKNAKNACRGRWSQCGGKYVNVNDISWHICNECSRKRIVAMANGFIRPNVRAVATTTTTTTKPRATKRAIETRKNDDAYEARERARNAIA